MPIYLFGAEVRPLVIDVLLSKVRLGKLLFKDLANLTGLNRVVRREILNNPLLRRFY
jgi:hypothetical protein